LSTDPNPLPPEALSAEGLASQEPPPLPLPPPARVPDENPPWTLWDVLAIAVVSFGATMLFGLIVSFTALHYFQTPLQAFEHNPRMVLPAELAGYLVTLAFMAALVRSRGLPFWRTVSWRWTSGIPGYVLLGFLLSVFVALATSVLPIPKSLPIEKYFADTIGVWMLAIFGVTVAPLMEELFFRGFLYPALARPLGSGWSVVITALGFALLHSPQLGGAWAPLLLLYIVGVVLTFVRVRTGSVVPGFFLHAAYNLTIFTEMYFQTAHFHNFSGLGG
jgi:hypothetical protein